MTDSQDTFARTCGVCERPLAGPVKFCPYCGSRMSPGDGKKVITEPPVNEIIEVPQTDTFNITVTSGPNGRISPENSAVEKGSSLTVTVTPDVGYRIGTISIDGKSLEPLPSYTFESINADHSIEASFSRLTFTIIYRKNGKEHDRFSVEYGSGKVIAIAPPDGCQLKDVLVDGVSRGKISECRLDEITSDHIVETLFEKSSDDADAGKEEREKKKPVGKSTWVTLIVVVLLLVVAAFSFFKKTSQSAISEVMVVSNPGGAKVMLDDKPAGKTPLELKGIAAGRHTLEISKKGHRQTRLEIELTGGKNHDIQADLPRLESPKLPTIPPSTSQPEVKPETPSAKPEDKPKEKPEETPKEMPIDARIQEAIDLYDNQQYAEAAARFKEILQVVPNNALAKFYLKRSLDAGK